MEARPSKTTCWKVDANRPGPEVIRRAGLLLRRGGLVAFPTETVYGLGADAFNGRAVAAIFTAKGRPVDNPLIVHLARGEDIAQVAAGIPPVAEKLVRHFWPGPLTLVLPGRGSLPREVTAGLDTVAVRVPDHPVALALIREAGVPVAAPSANASGRPSPTTAAHVLADLDGRIDALLDAGPCGLGVESTVLDLTGEVPLVLRPGGVTLRQLQEVAGPVALDPAAAGRGGNRGQKPRSPGLKYRHYAPRAPLLLLEGDRDKVLAELERLAREHARRGARVGLLCTREAASRFRDYIVQAPGRRGDVSSLARNLYGALRALDEAGVDVILAEGTGEEDLGLAVMNRLRRAAEKVIAV